MHALLSTLYLHSLAAHSCGCCLPVLCSAPWPGRAPCLAARHPAAGQLSHSKQRLPANAHVRIMLAPVTLAAPATTCPRAATAKLTLRVAVLYCSKAKKLGHQALKLSAFVISMMSMQGWWRW